MYFLLFSLIYLIEHALFLRLEVHIFLRLELSHGTTIAADTGQALVDLKLEIKHHGDGR